MNKSSSIIKPRPRIVVGVSGGVDSSVSLILLKKQGWDPVAVTLRLPIWKNKCNALCENVCCTQESRERSRAICKKFGVPYHIVDARKDFNKKVVDYFVDEYKNGRTPNPCVICNRQLKFKYLFDFAKKHNIKSVATGHYAKIIKNKNNQCSLAQAKDKTKDQTYSLSFLKRSWLNNIVFPLANITKDKVYKIAKKNGLNFYKKIKQSQDFCFVSGKALPNFLKATINKPNGRFATLDGKIVGTHDGAFLFTLGQRKGINVPAGPWYVVGIDAKSNIIYISKDEQALMKKELTVSNINWLVKPTFPLRAHVKIRSTHKSALATITKSRGRLTAIFNKKQRAITPGQIAVFYKNKQVLGAGKII
jgi:tRNA-specific 2-thiouridylase